MKPLAAEKLRILDKNRNFAVFGLLAFLPIAAILVPWDFGSTENQYRQLVASHSLSIIIVELLIFTAFLRNENLVSDLVKYSISKDKIAFFILLAGMSYSFLFVSTSKILFFLGLLVVLVHLFFSISLYKNMKSVGQQEQQYFWISVGVSVIGYAALWAADFQVFPPTENDWIERVPGVTNVRWAGFFWLTIFAAGLSLARASDWKYVLLAVIFGSFGLTLTLWTGTRGSLVAMCFGVLCALIIAPTYRRFIFKYCLISAVIAITINIYAPVPHDQYGMDRILSSSQRGNNAGSGRAQLWKSTFKISLEHPWVGHGIDQFQKMGPRETLGFKGPHSLPLQLLFSVGIIGLLVFMFGILRFLKIFRLEVKQPAQLAALTFFTGGCLYSIYDNFAYYPYPIAIFTISILMLFKPRDKTGPASPRFHIKTAN